ncbi:MAG: LysR family transcriptional regulator [Blautia sp.]|nr:LysR family transcriptional regulator [Clostridia bacterium]MDY4693777.1 LysR family transcriptional regulator [Blautia sp.]MDY5555823.1 LysR family transcriptional regulator [Blautia sp.]
MLDFRIETFLEVCKDMNFTKAAKRLNLTQPAVSQHVKWLEEKYQARLFDMQGKKVCLTPAGEMLKNSSATMQHDISFLKEKMQETSSKKREIKMGLTLTIAEFEMADHISRLLYREPEMSMTISVENTNGLLQKLEGGIIDFALVEGNFPGTIYHHELYSKQRYIAVCSPRESLAHGTYTISQLLDHRLILREAGSGTRNIMEHYLEMKGLSVDDFSSRIETGNIGLIKKLVINGCGISFLYQTAVRKELEEGSLCEIALSDMEITHDFNFIWRENSIFSEDYRKFFKILKAQ